MRGARASSSSTLRDSIASAEANWVAIVVTPSLPMAPTNITIRVFWPSSAASTPTRSAAIWPSTSLGGGANGTASMRVASAGSRVATGAAAAVAVAAGAGRVAAAGRSGAGSGGGNGNAPARAWAFLRASKMRVTALALALVEGREHRHAERVLEVACGAQPGIEPVDEEREADADHQAERRGQGEAHVVPGVAGAGRGGRGQHHHGHPARRLLGDPGLVAVAAEIQVARFEHIETLVEIAQARFLGRHLVQLLLQLGDLALGNLDPGAQALHLGLGELERLVDLALEQSAHGLERGARVLDFGRIVAIARLELRDLGFLLEHGPLEVRERRLVEQALGCQRHAHLGVVVQRLDHAQVSGRLGEIGEPDRALVPERSEEHTF